MKKINDAVKQQTVADNNLDCISKKTSDIYYENNVEMIKELRQHFKNYSLELYLSDLNSLGLKETWNNICEYVLVNGENPEFLKISNFGEMYEIGLAVQDKILKKKSGQYYTPDDIAYVMSEWLDECKEDNLCDVACGTGKLILTYLSFIGFEKAQKLINSGRIYLYDFDQIALNICKTSLIVKYKVKDFSLIHDVHCDFLDSEVHLPSNSKVISNPPYARIDAFNDNWKVTKTLRDTKEYYSAFMEKIFCEAESTVIITPFSFISGNKFYSLREQMCKDGYGFIVAFDNVPGNVFCGRKHGIFNTNTANSVRAAITVMHRSQSNHGFRVTPLIRFKNEERERLFKAEKLEDLLPTRIQIITPENVMFTKVFKDLDELFDTWVKDSDTCVKDILIKSSNQFFIDMPNTCRYFTTASTRKLSRGGSISMNVKDENLFDFLYCFINSSFTYWWWRIFDGGITYPSNLFMNMPLPINKLSEDDKLFFKQIREEMSSKEPEFIVTKVNAGVVQENIKFPPEYRQKINDRLLQILDSELDSTVFDKVHSNSYFGS